MCLPLAEYAIVLVLVMGCSSKPATKTPPTSPTPATEAKSTSTAQVVEQASAEVASTSPSVFPQVEQPTKISGLAKSRKDLAARKETDLVDPSLDGWSTEAFNESALKQLKLLGKWMEAGQKTKLPMIFADAWSSSELYPAQFEPLLQTSDTSIRRWLPATTQQEITSVAGFESHVSTWLPTDVRDVHVEFKIIGVDATEPETTTSLVRGHLSGTQGNASLQHNFGWQCVWSTVDPQEPRLMSIQLQEFEEVRQAITAKFVDRTDAVFHRAPSFQEQLSYPLDYWRDRMDWRFGWAVVGNHGLAMGDVNGDGLDDLYYAETGGLPNRLFLQQQDGSLLDASEGSGVDILEPTHGVLLIDLDNDGDQDLVAAVSRYILVFENDGQARFKQHPTLQSRSMMRSLVAADHNGDGLLDIYACGYSLRQSDSIGLGRPMPYHDANNGAPSYLMMNEGGFRFRDATEETGLDANNQRFSYAAAWEDYDNDGDLDLYVANDFGRNNLYRNDGGQFQDVAAEAGVEDIAAGMSVSWGDYNRDGWVDLYVSNMFSSAGNRIAYQRQFKSAEDQSVRAMYRRHARGNSLFENMGDGTFRDVSETARVTEARWAWCSQFVDINNDSWQDLLVANGMVTGTENSGDL